MTSERKTLKAFFHAQLMLMCQLVVAFSELSNNVDTIGTGSMCVVDSRIAICYG
jgi:5-keto 4-deoxyuronate isomerase